LGSHFGISVFHWILFHWILFICLFYNDSKVFFNTPSAVASGDGLSATDVDTDDDALTFTITNTSADFEIANGNELKTKRVLTTTGDRHVTIIASDGTRGIEKDFTIVVKKADEEDPDEKDPEEEAPVEDANAKVTAQSVRKESKSASKLLLSKVGRTLIIAQPVGTEHTIDKAVGLAIGKTDLNAIHKTIGTKTAFLFIFMIVHNDLPKGLLCIAIQKFLFTQERTCRLLFSHATEVK
jgi:hypothetical protein